MIAGFAFAAAAVAAVFTVACARAAWKNGSVPLWFWSFALLQFTVASAALAWGVVAGWSSSTYKLYYLFGAILNTTWLAVGSVWLLSRRTTAMAVAIVVAAASVVMAVLILLTPLLESAPRALTAEVVPHAELVMPEWARRASRAFSIAGSIVVVGGLLWSMARDSRKAPALGLLASGVVIVAIASVAARAGMVAPFSVGLAVGIGVMYLGFLRTP